MQGYKSATTYAKRIGIESLTGIAPEDDDGNAAAKAPPKAAPTISAEQFMKLQDQAFNANVDEAKIATAAKVPSLEQLPADQFASVMKKLQITIDAAQVKPDLSEELNDEIKY